ncbi:hypothetical protein HPB48_015144 [Haemaphysalis longicornis]|uniref:Aurora kinase n=1 Tax=Haemaphysalis longicornis TaxID=44386 RepID=A0A9J6FIQ1_HAELO|nr:hypothetical protein HPB48_015144 [Haemaphysalis longicornis]
MSDKENISPNSDDCRCAPEVTTKTDAIAKMCKPEWDLTDFHRDRMLGRCTFGHVYLARRTDSKDLLALKIIFTSGFDECDQDDLHKEIETQYRLKHPNVLQLHGCFHDDMMMYLVLEYAPGGELSNELHEAKLFDEKKSACYVSQLAKALQYCHSRKVIHRDIKPDNILVGVNEVLKVAGFGYAVHSPTSKVPEVFGSVDYLPPEMVEKKVHGAKVDLWALGVVAYEFLVGHTPFTSNPPDATCEKIRSVDFRFPPHVSAGAKDLISRLLVQEPTERATPEEVLSHPWITENTGM